jgi:hypothetical protein
LITGVATPFSGNYKINVDPGTYDVEVSYVGYVSSRCNGVLVRAGLNNKLDMRLGGSGGTWRQWNARKRRQKYGFEIS